MGHIVDVWKSASNQNVPLALLRQNLLSLVQPLEPDIFSVFNFLNFLVLSNMDLFLILELSESQKVWEFVEDGFALSCDGLVVGGQGRKVGVVHDGGDNVETGVVSVKGIEVDFTTLSIKNLLSLSPNLPKDVLG